MDRNKDEKGQIDGSTIEEFSLCVANLNSIATFQIVPQLQPRVIPTCKARNISETSIYGPQTNKKVSIKIKMNTPEVNIWRNCNKKLTT